MTNLYYGTVKQILEKLSELDDEISAINIDFNNNNTLLDEENKKLSPLRDKKMESAASLQKLNLDMSNLVEEEARVKKHMHMLKMLNSRIYLSKIILRVLFRFRWDFHRASVYKTDQACLCPATERTCGKEAKCWWYEVMRQRQFWCCYVIRLLSRCLMPRVRCSQSMRVSTTQRDSTTCCRNC